MINLKYSTYDTNKHAQVALREAGMTARFHVPQSIGDRWDFWDCQNVPDPLPEHFSVLEADPQEYVGYGLSQEMADELRAMRIAVAGDIGQ